MKKPKGWFGAMMGLKCPQCREGEIFKTPGLYTLDKMTEMHQDCECCGLRYEQEPGFWWGAMYVSYGLAVASALPTFLLLYLLAGVGFFKAVMAVLVVQAILSPMVFRLSRSIWLYMFGNYKYKPLAERTAN